MRTLQWTQGERRAEGVEAVVRAELAMHPGVQVEYIAVADPDSLEPVETVNERTVVMLAARVGHTRLIDNAILSKGI